jgi:hypothetical protein
MTVGTMVVYQDRRHVTRTYVLTLADELERRLDLALQVGMVPRPRRDRGQSRLSESNRRPIHYE